MNIKEFPFPSEEFKKQLIKNLYEIYLNDNDISGFEDFISGVIFAFECLDEKTLLRDTLNIWEMYEVKIYEI